MHGPFAELNFSELARMYVTPKQVIIASWILFALYWLIASFGVKRTVKRQDPAERLLYVVFMAAGFFLFYQENPNWGPLNRRFVSDEFLIAWLGKARKEESFLAAEFGAAFEEHRRQTGFFLPRIS